MNWEQKGKYRFESDDGNAVISASRSADGVLYAVWVRDPSQTRVHPVGWRCETVEMDPIAARDAIEKIN